MKQEIDKILDFLEEKIVISDYIKIEVIYEKIKELKNVPER